jgi:ubiquinone/menaquinone biosynthesis C-methylase UbiE
VNAEGRTDVWASGEPYEAYVGRWSRLVAAEFVDWLGAASGGRWLDVGSGTGALTSVVLERARPASVDGVDSSAGFVDHARSAVTDERVTFAVADARSLPFPDGRFDAVVSGLVLNFVPEPAAAVGEMARVVRSGGSAGAYVWDYAGAMQMMRRFWDAAVELDPTAADLVEGLRFAIAKPEPLHRLFVEAGFEEVETRPIDIDTRFHDFADYWTPFLGGQGPAPAYVASLPPDGRDALRDVLRARLPVEADGSIALRARAWAVRGRTGAG